MTHQARNSMTQLTLAMSCMWNISLCRQSTCCNKGPLSSRSHVACFYFWCPHTSSVHEGGLLLTRHPHIRIKLKSKCHTTYGRTCWLLKCQHLFSQELLTCNEKKKCFSNKVFINAWILKQQYYKQIMYCGLDIWKKLHKSLFISILWGS